MPTLTIPVDLTDEAYRYAVSLPNAERYELVSLASSIAFATAARHTEAKQVSAGDPLEIWSPHDAHDAAAAMLAFLQKHTETKP